MRRSFQIELPVRREWPAVETLRQAVTASLRAVFPDTGLCDALAMVAGELLENAVKYGGGPEGGGFRLAVTGCDDAVEVEVANPVAPGDPDVVRLLAEIDRIARAPSPQEAYLAALRRVALSRSKGGIGLARIVHEGGCDLTATLGDDGLLRVRARTRRLAPPPPTGAPPA